MALGCCSNLPNGKKKFEKYLYDIIRENIAQNSSTTVTYLKKVVKKQSMAAKSAAFLGKMMGSGKKNKDEKAGSGKPEAERDGGMDVQSELRMLVHECRRPNEIYFKLDMV